MFDTQIFPQIRFDSGPRLLIGAQPIGTRPRQVDDAVDGQFGGEFDEPMIDESQPGSGVGPVLRAVHVAGVHDPTQTQHPVDADIELVDEDEEPASGFEDAGHLGGGSRFVEPMPGLSDGDEVDALRLHAGVLSGADHRGSRIAFEGDSVGIDSDEFGAQSVQSAAEDPGSRAEVAHSQIGPLPVPPRQCQGEGRIGITGTHLVVDSGLGTETASVGGLRAWSHHLKSAFHRVCTGRRRDRCRPL